jgi:hypothetical protein
MVATTSNPTLDPADAIYDQEIPARQPWSRVVRSDSSHYRPTRQSSRRYPIL